MFKNKIKDLLASIENKYNNLKILDKYILKQVIEMFLMGVFVGSIVAIGGGDCGVAWVIAV